MEIQLNFVLICKETVWENQKTDRLGLNTRFWGFLIFYTINLQILKSDWNKVNELFRKLPSPVQNSKCNATVKLPWWRWLTQRKLHSSKGKLRILLSVLHAQLKKERQEESKQLLWGMEHCHVNKFYEAWIVEGHCIMSYNDLCQKERVRIIHQRAMT